MWGGSRDTGPYRVPVHEDQKSEGREGEDTVDEMRWEALASKKWIRMSIVAGSMMRAGLSERK